MFYVSTAKLLKVQTFRAKIVMLLFRDDELRQRRRWDRDDDDDDDDFPKDRAGSIAGV